MLPSMRQAVRLVALIAAACAAAGAAHAVPITYTMRGVASGSLGATNFANAGFVVTVNADTDTVMQLGPGIPCNDPTQATFAITGVASGSITSPVSVADNDSWQLIAIARGRCVETGPMWTNGRHPQLGSYDLAAKLDPIALAMPSAPPGVSVDTSGGVLAFSSVSDLTFQAQPGLQVAAAQVQITQATAVPTLSESGIGLLAVLIGGIGACTARRRGAT